MGMSKRFDTIARQFYDYAILNGHEGKTFNALDLKEVKNSEILNEVAHLLAIRLRVGPMNL